MAEWNPPEDATAHDMGPLYELFIHDVIHDILAPQVRFQHSGHGRSNHLVGRSGVEHQADVSFLDTKYSRLVVIECKLLRYHKLGTVGNTIKLEVVKTLKAALDDLAGGAPFPNSNDVPASVLGIVVSTGGPQKSAAKFARACGIQLARAHPGRTWGFTYDDCFSLAFHEKLEDAKASFTSTNTPVTT